MQSSVLRWRPVRVGTRWPFFLAYLQLSVVDELLWRISTFYRWNRREHWARILVVLAATWLASGFRRPCDVATRHDFLADLSLCLLFEAKKLDIHWLRFGFCWLVLYFLRAYSNLALPKTKIQQICHYGVRSQHSVRWTFQEVACDLRWRWKFGYTRVNQKFCSYNRKVLHSFKTLNITCLKFVYNILSLSLNIRLYHNFLFRGSRYRIISMVDRILSILADNKSGFVVMTFSN